MLSRNGSTCAARYAVSTARSRISGGGEGAREHRQRLQVDLPDPLPIDHHPVVTPPRQEATDAVVDYCHRLIRRATIAKPTEVLIEFLGVDANVWNQ